MTIPAADRRCPTCGAAFLELGPDGTTCARGHWLSQESWRQLGRLPPSEPSRNGHERHSGPVTRYEPSGTNPDPDPYIESGSGFVSPGGADIVKVWEYVEPRARRFVLQGLIPEGATSIFYGDAGIAKTLTAISIATHVASGADWLGLAVERGRLYIDAELDLDEFTRRAYRIARGVWLSGPPKGLHYLRLPASLGDRSTMAYLARAVEQVSAHLVVLDSLSVASFGVDLERPADMTTIMQGLRSLGTVLAVDHIPKPMPGVNASHYRPFGSQFKYAIARSVVQLVGGDSGQAVVLRPTKANFGPKASPIPIAVRFTPEAVSLERTDLGAGDLAGLEDQLPAGERVAAALTQYPDGALPETLAGELDLDEKTVKNHLTALRKTRRAEPLGDGRWRAPQAQIPSRSYIGTGIGILPPDDPSRGDQS